MSRNCSPRHLRHHHHQPPIHSGEAAPGGGDPRQERPRLRARKLHPARRRNRDRGCAPRILRRSRTEGGNRISDEEAASLQQQLSELREIALVLVAEVVDHQLEDYLRRQGIEQNLRHPRTHSRLRHTSLQRLPHDLPRQAQAERFHGELFVAYVEQDHLTPARSRDPGAESRSRSPGAGARSRSSTAKTPSPPSSASPKSRASPRSSSATASAVAGLQSFSPNPVDRLILEADGIDIRIFPNSGVRRHA